MSNMPQIIQSERKDVNELAQHYRTFGRVHIPQFLTPSSALEIHRSLADQKQWNLAWNNQGEHKDMDYESVQNWTASQKAQLNEIIYAQAEREFQYCYAAVPIYDIYQNKLLPGHFFNSIFEFFNDQGLIKMVRAITGNDRIEYADIQATRYSRGHFLTEHDDDVQGKNRLAAYVLNLTPEWRNDWGGALVFSEDERKCAAFFPKFNAFNIFAVPQKHFVSMVSPFAPVNRYSITGWFRY